MFETAIDIGLIALLAMVCFAGVAMALLQLPGTWTIIASVVAYAWYYDWVRIGPTTLYIIIGLAVVGEIIEGLGGAVMAKRGGASKRAAWYGLAGGMIGAFFLSIPVPVIGTLIGAAVGCFAGAFLAEWQLGKGLGEGTRAGVYTAVGRTLGSMAKVFIAATIACVATVQAITPFWQ